MQYIRNKTTSDPLCIESFELKVLNVTLFMFAIFFCLFIQTPIEFF